MGQSESKKKAQNNVQTTRFPPVTEPRLPGYWARKSSESTTHHQPLSTYNFHKPTTIVAEPVRSWQSWSRDYDKFKNSQENENLLQARIRQQDEGRSKIQALERSSFQLRLDRIAAESANFLRTTIIPTSTNINALRPIESKVLAIKKSDEKYFTIKPKRPQLTDEMVQHIQRMKSAPQTCLLTEIDGLQILGKDIRTLIGLNWLNDEIINAYMTLLVYRGKKPKNKTVHAFNTFFYPKLREQGYTSVRRWTRKVDIFDYEYILVPVHLGNHWTLIFIDLMNKKISYYDSLGGYDDGHCDTLLDYLRSEKSDKKKEEFCDSGWDLRNKSHDGIPKQHNCSDCGVFACIYAEHLTRNVKLEFSQEDMPYFRDRMIYEITTQKILE